MRLSEAIRLGSMLKPQGVQLYWDNGKTCAVGAALDAIGQLEKHAAGDGQLTDFWPELDRDINRPPNSKCPVLGCSHVDSRLNVASTVFHLNDDHRWTREQIADWVETIENSVPQPVAAPIPEEVTQ